MNGVLCRSPEPRLVARALYNFVGQSAKELTFRKGELIYVRRQIDKNWYEGELNAMVGLFPVNYVEVSQFKFISVSYKRVLSKSKVSYVPIISRITGFFQFANYYYHAFDKPKLTTN